MKRVLVSDIARVFADLGWFAPATVSMKILLQQLWVLQVDWDDSIPKEIHDVWMQWRTEAFSAEQVQVASPNKKSVGLRRTHSPGRWDCSHQMAPCQSDTGAPKKGRPRLSRNSEDQQRHLQTTSEPTCCIVATRLNVVSSFCIIVFIYSFDLYLFLFKTIRS